MNNLAAEHAADYPLLVAAELERTSDNRFLLLASGRVFQIGELLFDVIGQLQGGQTLAAVCAESRRQGPVALHEAEVDRVLRSYLTPASEQAPKRSSYLHTRFDLVGEELLCRLYTPFLGLFQPRLLVVLLALTSLLTAAFFHTWGVFVLKLASEKLVLCTVVAYVAMVGGVFFHELGHATAAARFGVAPKTIGFGFYLIFPVFFTDVTNVWRLNKHQRIVVNLAGVYFQLLFSALLIGAFYLIPAAHGLTRILTGTVLSMNIFVVLYSLNPFLRNDGYWVYSDFFEIPNLMSRSMLYPWRLLKLVAPENSAIPTTFSFPKDLALLIYSAANYGLSIYFLKLFATYSTHTLVPRLAQLLQPADFPRNLLTLDNGFFLLKTFGLYGFMVYMTIYSLWRNYHNYRLKRARLAALAQAAAPAPAAATALAALA